MKYTVYEEAISGEVQVIKTGISEEDAQKVVDYMNKKYDCDGYVYYYVKDTK